MMSIPGCIANILELSLCNSIGDYKVYYVSCGLDGLLAHYSC